MVHPASNDVRSYGLRGLLRKTSLKKYRLFLLLPLVQVLSSIIYFKSYKQVVSSAVFIISDLVFSIAALKILTLLDKKFDGNGKISSICLLFSLTALDQINKVILEKTYLNCNIISVFFQIHQKHNINQTALFNFFDMMPGVTAVVIFKTVCLLFLFFCFFKVKNKNLYMGLLLLTSAQISNLMDSLIRGYTLDSFYYYKLVCYDLKDFYVDAGIGIIIIAFLTNKKEIEVFENESGMTS